MNFTPLTHENNLSEIIKNAFDMELSIAGGWGYTQEEATIIKSFQQVTPKQFEHTFASMRAYGEMNMTLPEEERYGSINVNELSREEIKDQGKTYDKVEFEISAMKECDYAKFIDEYKEGYGTDIFDMEDHFNRRKESTLRRIVIHWFDITDTI